MATDSLRWRGLILDATVKSLILAAIAASVIRGLKLRNSQVRHRIWIGILAGMLVLPVLPEIPETSSADTETTSSAQDEFRYVGTVVDDKDQPVEGARVLLNYWRARNDDVESATATATTDAKGKFEIKRRRSDFGDSMEEKPWGYARLVAMKTGYGIAADSATLFDVSGSSDSELPDDQREILKRERSKPSALKLSPDRPIRGKIVDTEGRPIVGALIEPFKVDKGANDSLEEWEKAAKGPGASAYSLRLHLRSIYGVDSMNGPVDRTLAPAKTDSGGVFTLTGIGRERIVSAVLSGPGIESSIIRIRTKDGEPIKLPMVDQREGTFSTYHPAEFTHVAGPSQPVEGIVTDLRTGKPIAGVVLRGEATATERVLGGAGFIQSTTDQDGRFRLNGFPAGQNTFAVLPTIESGYLPAGMEIKSTAGPEPLLTNISLTPGVRARGAFREAVSGKPIRGYVEYFAFAGNAALQETRNFRNFNQRMLHPTDQEGTFEIPVLPGPGVIAFRANDPQAFTPGEGEDQIKRLGIKPAEPRFGNYAAEPQPFMAQSYHGLIAVDPATDARSIDVSLKLTRLKSFQGKVLSEDGGVLDKFVLHGERLPGNWYEHNSPVFTVTGYQPADGRRLMAYDPNSDRVGLLDITADSPSSVEIRLQPAARIVGRIVDEDGKPIAGVTIRSGQGSFPNNLRGKFDPERADFIGRPGRPLMTGDDGRFELLGVFPGLKYSATASGTRRIGNRMVSAGLGPVFTDLVVKPGERHDLGDVKVRTEKP